MLPWNQIERALHDARPLRLSGRVVRSDGLMVEGTLPGAQLGMMCRLMIRGRADTVPAEIVAVRGRRVSLMPLMAVPGISVGSRIEPVAMDATVPVSEAMVGRVLDGLGQPIDGGPPLHASHRVPLHPPPLNPLSRGSVKQALPLGITALDGMLTCAEGQRLVIMAGAGVGKSTLLGMMARHTAADITVVALIGERSREVKEFVESELGTTGLRNSVVVAATSNTSVAMRLRAARVATAVCEFFRDQGKRVLLLMDSLTRVCMAQRELGLATGEAPGTRGYPPSAFAIIPQLLERAGPGTRGGSITAFYTALLEGDDTHDPIGDAIRAVTDGHVVLDRRLAEQGHFPAIDVLASVSRVMPRVTNPEHIRQVGLVRRLVAVLKEAEELRMLGAYRPGENAQFDSVLPLADDVWTFLRQGPEGARTYEETLQHLSALADRFESAEATAREATLLAAAGEEEP